MKRGIRMTRIAVIIGLCLAGFSGCGIFGQRRSPPPIEYSVDTPYAGVRTLAVAPAINLSGNRDFDPLVISDLLYSEMQQVRGLNVLPLNKTLLAMRRLDVRNIDDVATAQRLADIMGADALIIPAVTAYDPYKPPTVGMVLQMYTSHNAAVVREAPAASNVSSRTGEGMGDVDRQPVSQVSAVFNAANQSVVQELKAFASGRADYETALADQRFLWDSDAYMRFVCHAMVRRLLDVERDRVADR